MRINHNISAINTNRLLGANNSATSKSLEKLSSGFRVNRAGDDAAGLAISEKMRGQIRGLNQASSNANDGISLIQTAEGALNETHSILQRMRELAVQSANDTNTTSDRTELQKEIEQLTKEITRISTDTEFNTQKLLDGTMAATATAEEGSELEGMISVAAGSILENGEYDITVTVTKAADPGEGGTAGTPASAVGTGVTVNGTYTGKSDATYKYFDKVDAKGEVLASASASNGSTTTSGTYNGTSDVKLTYKTNGGGGWAGATGWYTDEEIANSTGDSGASATPAVTGATGTYMGVDIGGSANADDTITFTARKDAVEEKDAGWYEVDEDGNAKGNAVDLKSVGLSIDEETPTEGNTITATAAKAGTPGEGATDAEYTITATDKDGVDVSSNFKFDNEKLAELLADKDEEAEITAKVTVDDSKAMTFHIGANSGQNTKLTIQDMGAKSLGVDAIDLTTQASADAAITTIDDAINTVSAQRAALGAMQNRLEHTINNLGTSSENLSAAESQIRDVDMAEEMSEFTKNNILVQAATAMLAQANQQPQNVLSLLQ